MLVENIFKKNLNALSAFEYKELKKKLQDFKSLQYFKYTLGKDPLDVNIIRNKDLKPIYKNPLKELQENLDLFNNQFLRYPVLFFYGLGNGILYKALLQNQERKCIIIFEKELEIIYIALNFLDFSEELKNNRLIILHTEQINYATIDSLFSIPNIELFFKTYALNLHSPFYKNYEDDVQKINQINLQAMITIALRNGNDPGDAMMGIRHFVHNLPKMLTHYKKSDLLKKRRNCDTAIIVSTGPSLAKQLPLLKQYANKATIFCVDASYNTLAKHNIKPDYVLSLERSQPTSEFFNNDFGEFDKDILFIILSLTHENTIKYLEKNKRNYMLVIRNLAYARSLKLDDFGYLGGGLSVAHMCCELALQLNYKNILLIGQDLAYANDGSTHSSNFIHKNLHTGDYERDFGKFRTTAYGGNGEVESSELWTLFRRFFEKNFKNTKTKIYNCTEGGARIHGFEEKPFKEACEEFLIKDLKKPFTKLKKPSKQESNTLMLDAYKKIKKNISLGETFNKECKKVLNQICKVTQGKNTLTLSEINANIDKIKFKLEKPKYSFLREILGPTLYHEESNLAALYVKNITNESEKQNKLFAWIYAHESLFETIVDLIKIQNQELKKAIIPLQDELEKRKLI
ncbi:PseE protein [Campylobacter jejuni]|uniref:motility associated factor glycosyltransferase family protein n=1 Tax=Campylobacter jejuni TaxID=197 RepID=UPI000F80AE90|nr:motility associated factor glycosyltransferase family protein [Campylobacter jejuni]RTJ77236.1 PseE protein [Campylobacter jejuni]RTJ86882.1 PseE protein [Campylobacter jejuni]RTJ93105.1 PseE protein [Campylobacter jejuni]